MPDLATFCNNLLDEEPSDDMTNQLAVKVLAGQSARSSAQSKGKGQGTALFQCQPFKLELRDSAAL